MARDRVQETERSYDAVAPGYAVKSGRSSGEAAEFFARFVEALGPASLVCDLGCGPGADGERLRQAGHAILGLDRSQAMLELARRWTQPVRGDIRSLPLAPTSVDGIWSAAVLLHVDRLDLSATLNEWRRVLKPGGLLALTTSVGSDEGWEAVPAAPSRVPAGTKDAPRWFVHHHRSSITTPIQSAGFEIVESSIRASHRDWLQLIAKAPH